MKKILFAVALMPLTLSVAADTKWHKQDKGAYVEITQEGGRTLGYNHNSGVKILTVDGFAFKDLNRNGRLDKYEDWRLSSLERAKDLASQLSLEEIAGLMLYSSHQDIPGNYTDVDPAKHGYYNGLSFPQTCGVSPSALTDQQVQYVKDNVRHFLVRTVKNAYIAADWNNNIQALCESTRLGIPANNSSDPRHRATKSGSDEFDAGGGNISYWPIEQGMAATFDPAVMKSFATIAAREYRAMGITTALSPQADLPSEPRWRRARMVRGAHKVSMLWQNIGQAEVLLRLVVMPTLGSEDMLYIRARTSTNTLCLSLRVLLLSKGVPSRHLRLCLITQFATTKTLRAKMWQMLLATT